MMVSVDGRSVAETLNSVFQAANELGGLLARQVWIEIAELRREHPAASEAALIDAAKVWVRGRLEPLARELRGKLGRKGEAAWLQNCRTAYLVSGGLLDLLDLRFQSILEESSAVITLGGLARDGRVD